MYQSAKSITITKAVASNTKKSKTPTKQELLQRYARSPRGRTTVAASKLISAAYVLSANERMTPAETCEAVYQFFNVRIDRKDVYSYRKNRRNRNQMTPHDRSCKFVPKGYTQVKKEV